MRCVYKYVLGSFDYSIGMPIGARILAVNSRSGELYIWAMVDPKAGEMELQYRHFKVYRTGCNIKENPLDLNYIGTVRLDKEYGIHVFEYTGGEQ